MIKKLLALALVTIALAACAPDPRKEAQAYAIQSGADQTAADQTIAREQGEELHALDVQQQQIEIAHRRAIAAQWDIAVNRIVWAFGYIAIAVIVAVAFSISRASLGIGNAMVRAAEVRANLIQLNPVTRQFPLFVQHIHGAKYIMHNPNTGSVILLDERNEADRQMIAAAGVTQVTGVLAQEARASNDPAGVSMIRPPVIEVKENDTLIGDHFIEHLIEG